MRYERIREIYNSCDNSKMRDVEIEEIECDDVDADVLQFCNGTHVSCEKHEKDNGLEFDINNDGLQQKIRYTIV